MKFNLNANAMALLGLAAWQMTGAAVQAQEEPTTPPPSEVEVPAPSFLEKALAENGSRPQVAVVWSATPVAGAPGVYKIAISAPAKWEKAFLVIDGKAITLITPQSAKEQNASRRKGLAHLPVKGKKAVEVEGLGKAVPQADEARAFLWNFGAAGKPADVKLLVYTANGQIGVGN
jgi:hypothetical protein